MACGHLVQGGRCVRVAAGEPHGVAAGGGAGGDAPGHVPGCGLAVWCGLGGLGSDVASPQQDRAGGQDGKRVGGEGQGSGDLAEEVGAGGEAGRAARAAGHAAKAEFLHGVADAYPRDQPPAPSPGTEAATGG